MKWNQTIKVCNSCSWQCPGTSVPSTPQLKMYLYLCSYRSNTWESFKGLKELQGEPEENSVTLMRCHWVTLPLQRWALLILLVTSLIWRSIHLPRKTPKECWHFVPLDQESIPIWRLSFQHPFGPWTQSALPSGTLWDNYRFGQYS